MMEVIMVRFDKGIEVVLDDEPADAVRFEAFEMLRELSEDFFVTNVDGQR
jgi:hypothetical protein